MDIIIDSIAISVMMMHVQRAGEALLDGFSNEANRIIETF